jgi:hypothetical protein
MVALQSFCWEVAEEEGVVGNTALPLTSKLHCDPSSSHAFASLTRASALGLTSFLLPTSVSHSSVQSRSVAQRNRSRQLIPSYSLVIQLAFLRAWYLDQEEQRHPSFLYDVSLTVLDGDRWSIAGLRTMLSAGGKYGASGSSPVEVG